MDLDPVGWVVHRHLVDPHLDDAEPRIPAAELVASAAAWPDDLRDLDTSNVRAYSDGVSPAG